MADLIIVYWRDIPAQIMVRQGRRSVRRELPARFAEAIDMAAMRSGASGTDDYLAEWRRGEPIAVGDDLDAEADRAAAEIETQFDKASLVALVNSGGRNAG